MEASLPLSWRERQRGSPEPARRSARDLTAKAGTRGHRTRDDI